MFNLTRQERLIVVFLSFTALIGVGVNYYRKVQRRIEVKVIPATFEKERVNLDEIIKRTREVNINTSGIEQIMRLPGVGKTLAKRIIDYRETYGPFKEIEDIKNVKGIGPQKFKEIKEFLILE